MMRCPRESTRHKLGHEVPDVTQGEQHLMAEVLLTATNAGLSVEAMDRAVGVLKRLKCMAGGAA